MSAPIDLQTLGVVVAALRRAFDFEWRPLLPPADGGETLEELIAARRACGTTLKWAEALCRGEAHEEPDE